MECPKMQMVCDMSPVHCANLYTRMVSRYLFAGSSIKISFTDKLPNSYACIMNLAHVLCVGFRLYQNK